MPISEATYERVALEDPEGHWELICGVLRRKPEMTLPHNTLSGELAFLLRLALDATEFEVRHDSGRAKRDEAHYFVPDVMVIPRAEWRKLKETPLALEAYAGPLPLVAEVWSPSTGEYDLDEKLPEYRRRGDLEVWRLHPYERTLTAWRRQADGSYREQEHRSGRVELHAISGVAIDLDVLFASLDR
jgi:Uma2 family endonuclease